MRACVREQQPKPLFERSASAPTWYTPEIIMYLWNYIMRGPSNLKITKRMAPFRVRVDDAFIKHQTVFLV